MAELKELEKRVADLDARMEAGFKGVDLAFADMNAFVGHEVGRLRQEMNTRFDGVDNRFDRLETKLDRALSNRARTRRTRKR